MTPKSGPGLSKTLFKSLAAPLRYWKLRPLGRFPLLLGLERGLNSFRGGGPVVR